MAKNVPSVSVTYARSGVSTRANALGMRPMQERAYERRGEQYLLIKSPPASGKSRALMFIALDKLENQGVKQAIIVVPERTIGASFNDEPLSQYGFWSDWRVEPKWNLCNAPGNDNGGKVKALGAFLDGQDKVLVCTHATFRFAVDAYGVEAFDDRLTAVDEFHHVSSNPDNKLGVQLGEFMARGRTHIVAMTGSYFRGDAEAVLAPQDESKFDTVTYTYYEQLNGYEYLRQRCMTTEAEALANILAWSTDSPSWQCDALRRLATQATLEPAEIDELASICKGDNPAVLLEAGHFRGPNRDQGEVYLRQVHGVRHVNALAPDQRLTLHRVGLTIIYGDNGSGKSGYARILKKVCRARMPGRAEEIAPDIYDPAPGTPSATIEYAISGQNRTYAWQLGQAADTALSGISVFDSRTANVHVDDTNDVAYTPFPLKLLGVLAQLCKSVKDKLAAEIAQIKA